MRFAKSEEVEVIEKEIESFRAKIETLEKQKKDIDLKIKYAKARISRREKKLKTLS
jgi:chaperonin cofactor prefoldin